MTEQEQKRIISSLLMAGWAKEQPDRYELHIILTKYYHRPGWHDRYRGRNHMAATRRVCVSFAKIPWSVRNTSRGRKGRVSDYTGNTSKWRHDHGRLVKLIEKHEQVAEAWTESGHC
jgi:hypothetical protein